MHMFTQITAWFKIYQQRFVSNRLVGVTLTGARWYFTAIRSHPNCQIASYLSVYNYG